MSKQIYAIMKNSDLFSNIWFVDFLGQSLFLTLKELLKIRKEKYNISVQTFPSNHFKYRIVHYLLGAKKRIGHDYHERPFPHLAFLNNIRIMENGNDHAVIENYRLFNKVSHLRFLQDKKLFLKLDIENQLFAKKYLQENAEEKTFFVGVHAGSDHFKNLINKRWSADKFSEFIDLLTIRFTEIKQDTIFSRIKFLLFGAGEEEDLNKIIVKSCNYYSNCQIVSGTRFLESAAIIEKCHLFISNDSGLMHTATALQVPVISLFGPTSEIYAKPWRVNHLVITSDVECRPCFGYSRSALKCKRNDKKYKCLKELTPDEVLRKSKSFLDNLFYTKN